MLRYSERLFCRDPNMEEVPMSKFVAMVQIHKDAVEAIKKDP